MATLRKATLQEVKADKNETPVGTPIDVQFNPTTLKVAHANSLEGGKGKSRQRRQYIASSSTTLTLELHFDTADEEKTPDSGEPRSVEERVNFVRKFVLPKESGKKEVPPRLRFSWGGLTFTGIVEKLDIDYDHFAETGTPLRAKVNLSIKEQDAEFQFLKKGSGNRENDGGSDSNPGTSDDSGSSDSSAPAMDGETAPEFAARNGLDPSAWRGLDVDLGVDLSLEAGIEVGFSAGLSFGAGIGIGVGFEAGLDIGLEASFGLEASASVSAGFSASFGASVDANLAAGFSLAAAGGLNAAIDSVAIAKSSQAVSDTVNAFGASGVSTSTAIGSSSTPTTGGSASGGSSSTRATSSAARQPSRPDQTRTPMRVSGNPTASQQAAAPSAPSPPRVDPRAASFAAGVPLRPRVEGAAQERSAALGARATLRSRSGDGSVPTTSDPTVPAWEALQRRRSASDGGTSSVSRGSCGCGPRRTKKT